MCPSTRRTSGAERNPSLRSSSLIFWASSLRVCAAREYAFCASAFLPAPLVKLSDSALDLPEFPRQPDLLGQGVSFVQVIYRPFGVAFELAKDC